MITGQEELYEVMEYISGDGSFKDITYRVQRFLNLSIPDRLHNRPSLRLITLPHEWKASTTSRWIGEFLLSRTIRTITIRAVLLIFYLAPEYLPSMRSQQDLANFCGITKQSFGAHVKSLEQRLGCKTSLTSRR